MQLIGGKVVISATDINNFLACDHLTTLDLTVMRGELDRPTDRPGQADLLAKLGVEHEQNYLARLRAEGRQVTTIVVEGGQGGIARAAAATEAAMARGDEVIYQATFFDGVSLGYADFLRRISEARPGGRWAWHYEVEDTKLARHTEPYFLLQLSFYSEHVARIQGVAPARMHVILGNGERESFRVEDYAAYYRSVRARFLSRLADETDAYPAPVPHCGLCVWKTRCEAQREADDHLSLVANITRQQTARLNDAGILTLRSLAAAAPEAKPPKMQAKTFGNLRRQARLQEQQRLAIARGDADPYKYELLESGIREIVIGESASLVNGVPENGVPQSGVHQSDGAPENAAKKTPVWKPRGFYLLPEPSPGDVFFDMEGDPYYDIGTGLEYLFGAHTPEGEFHAFWGCDRSDHPIADRLAEKRAFEAFVDFAMARRERDPGMHIYHYASYEKTALQKLSLRHATREDDVDVILREGRLVDLYTVVRQAIAVGQPSYSIKKIEEFYGKRGSESKVAGGDESILWFEEWLAQRTDPARRDDAILADLERYNQYDCVSTYDLREWLLKLRALAAEKFAVEIPPYEGEAVEPQTQDPKFAELKAALDARIPEDFDPAVHDARSTERALFLARHMLEYHWRERKPVYWRFFDRVEKYADDPQSLIDDSESIVGLTHVGEPVDAKQSVLFTMRFPTQLHKLSGGGCEDLSSTKTAGTIMSIEEEAEYGTLVLKRSKRNFTGVALPTAITSLGIVYPSSILDAIARFAKALLEDGNRCRYRAAYDVLTAAGPRLRVAARDPRATARDTGGAAPLLPGLAPYLPGAAPNLSGAGHGPDESAPGARIQPLVVDEDSVRAVCDRLDDSYLFIQGPPGSGKTYLGARLIVDLLERKQKVGITANSHKAIHNLLDEVEAVAAARGVTFVGFKKCTEEPQSRYDSAHISSRKDPFSVFGAHLFAGTAWAFGPDSMDQQLDYLFIDEAGQVALPHAIAVMTAARNTIFLGDPLQLPQVTHTQHPGDLGASVLEHLLGHELRPVAPDRGILLTDSYRMHPDVCRFISELLYEGKLRSAPGRELQDVRSPGLSGTGLRYLPIEHTGNMQRSEEEAKRIAAEIEQLLHGTVRDVDGVTRPLTMADVIVVTPYNAQVTCIKRNLKARGLENVEVGTVDKFQGREAYVVFFSTAASSPEDASRGISFVFDRQRFNVAISRARALAVMVGSPALLVHHCTSIDQVLIANGVCRFIEEAGEFAPKSRPKSRESYAVRSEVRSMEGQVEQISGVTPAGLPTDSPPQEREPDEVLYADMDDVLAASDLIATRDAELLRLLAE
jgi:uncharacterized protein